MISVNNLLNLSILLLYLNPFRLVRIKIENFFTYFPPFLNSEFVREPEGKLIKGDDSKCKRDTMIYCIMIMVRKMLLYCKCFK